MDLEAFLEHLNSGKMVQGGSDAHLFMHGVSQEALRITAEMNGRYHEPEKLRALFSQLIGRPVDESFGLFPPFYTDCGKNIHIGKRVFINMGCKFQDQGGIFVGDGTPIYYYNMCGQMKTLLDRANPLFSANYQFRDVFLLAAAAEEDEHTVDGAVTGLQGWIDCFEKARFAGTVFAGGVTAVGEVRHHPALQKAYELGKNS